MNTYEVTKAISGPGKYVVTLQHPTQGKQVWTFGTWQEVVNFLGARIGGAPQPEL